MKYVANALLSVSILFALCGCDISADLDIKGEPVNSGGGDSLDPDDDFNIVAYFYTDRPVEGLRYVCSGSGGLPILGKTDTNGSFVCPRDRRVTFYVGDPNGVELGAVDLKIFGKRAPVADDGSNEGEADARENVTITPSTLHGSIRDASYPQVANAFQLLHLLDTSVAGVNPQERIVLTPEVHTEVSKLAASVVLTQSTDNFAVFADYLGDFVTDAGITLRSGGVALNPSLDLPQLVNRALVSARAGLYRYAPSIIGYNEPPPNTTRLFRGSVAMLVGRNGQTSGMGYSWAVDGAVSTFDTMTLAPGGTIRANGRMGSIIDPLVNELVFGSSENEDFKISGRMVNDRLFGSVALLDPTLAANYKIPHTYPVSGNANDVGRFVTAGGDIEGSLTLYRQFESLPDVELDVLGASYLPREFGLAYQDYPDGTLATDTQRRNNAYGGAPRLLRFRVLKNGDIVSVTPGHECTNVTDDAGQYRRADNTPESVIGQVGASFLGTGAAPKRYMTLALAIYDPTHPDFGFHLGTPALDGVALDPVVLDVATNTLVNKFCDPESTDDCDRYLEWFNTDAFYHDVFEPLALAGSSIPDAESGQAYLRKPAYTGRVTALIQDLCP